MKSTKKKRVPGWLAVQIPKMKELWDNPFDARWDKLPTKKRKER
jgi:hypothetical protein